MNPNDFSRQQRAALLALRGKQAHTRDVALASGTGKGTGSMLGALKGRGMIRYHGSGYRPGAGLWSLTPAGEDAARAIAELDAAKGASN